jgi:hypothetical protein
MAHPQRILFILGFLLLGVASFIVDLRVRRAAKTNAPYLSPLDATTERVPAPLRVWQYLLWALSAGVIAIRFTIRGEYVSSSVWYLHVVVALYIAWVYRRGREPKIMEGFWEFPDPPSLLRKP